MKIGDIVVEKATLGTIVGQMTDGRWVVEFTNEELYPLSEEGLFLVEESNGLPSEN